ncbi:MULTISPECIES: tyrosine-type recombinase/integrase [Bacteroidaceae]|uniref:tyrosine-type recombinase/integrase n=3 Tax=Bacteroidales TaxID=171549 RepID=UPI000E541BB2|nr:MULTISPECIES: tyrosine-type recombinase/integrase [Bacteroidaceae]RHE48764.1 recombinase [Bacteroides stercoris]
MPLFSKQAANSLVTETSQYFVFFCRSVCSANLAKCLIINVLRLIIVILFFIAFLNITYTARHTFAVTVCLENGLPIETLSKMLGHTNLKVTQAYARITYRKVTEDMKVLKNKLKDWKPESGPMKSDDI